MGKIAFLFPGQGSQEVGMAGELFKQDPHFRSLIEAGSEFVDEDLEKLCLKGPEKKLRFARYLQPILSAVCLGYYHHLVTRGLKADYVLGHSLGEITSLGASGVVSLKETVVIAAKRGVLMDAAASKCNGAMMAVLFVPVEKVEELLHDINGTGKIVLANDNAPNQLVLSGDVELLDAFSRRVTREKLGRCQKLLVAGPWHSNSMVEARVAFEEWAQPIEFKNPHTPIILNATSQEEIRAETIKHLITWQLTRPVYWRKCMERLRELQVDTLVEIGPGRVLSGLARVNGYKRGVGMYNVCSMKNVESTVTDLVEKVIK